MKSPVSMLLLFSILVSAAAPAQAWTFGGNLFFISTTNARSFSLGVSDEPETFTHMAVSVILKEEGTTVDSDDDTCQRSGNGGIFCGVIANDPTLTNTCEYCGSGDGAVVLPGIPFSKSWGVKCRPYLPPGTPK